MGRKNKRRQKGKGEEEEGEKEEDKEKEGEKEIWKLSENHWRIRICGWRNQWVDCSIQKFI